MIHTPAKFNITSRILNTSCAKLVIEFGLIARDTTDILGYFKKYVKF